MAHYTEFGYRWFPRLKIEYRYSLSGNSVVTITDYDGANAIYGHPTILITSQLNVPNSSKALQQLALIAHANGNGTF